MNIETLRNHLKPLIPTLDSNLHSAYQEYMDGDIPHGTYNYVLGRHGTAHALMSSDELPEFEQCLRALSPCIMDLRAGIKDLQGDEQKAATEHLSALLNYFKDSGFTETNKMFDIPVKPSEEAQA